jgi:hypothetical protein
MQKKLLSLLPIRNRRVTIVFLLLVVTVGSFVYLSRPVKTKITTGDVPEAGLGGHVIQGANTGSKGKLATTSKLTYESRTLTPQKRGVNAAVLKWDQPSDQPVGTQFRTFNGKQWSPWLDASSDDDRKDNTPAPTSTLLLSNNIQQLQYRLTIRGTSAAPTTMDPAKFSIETIDSTHGPSPTKKTAWQHVASLFGFGKKASARPGGPPILSRLSWGSPEPYDSPRWTPEYRPLNRIIVHHTVTTADADSAATVRAIWYYHANTLGWGDIGYNYLVDQWGNIFQGRWYDDNYAFATNQDVVGGHAYGNNYGTSGIAAIGDFTNTDPSNSLLHYIGELAAYKGGPYQLNPAEGTTYGGNLVGHRDVLSTACPGQRLYDKLQTIRDVANAVFPKYRINPYTWQYVNQYAYADANRTQALNLNAMPLLPDQRVYLTVQARNMGTKVWYRDGPNPARLGTINPTDRMSSGCDTGAWLACNRPTSLAEPSVAPGQLGSFMFSYVVPHNTNVGNKVTTSEYFNPLIEGVSWMNVPGLYWNFTVERPYMWQYVTQQAYTDAAHQNPIDLNNTPINAGQRIYLSVSARNVGSETWHSSGAHPVRLGTSNPVDRLSALCDNGTWISCSRAANLSESSVAPGATGTFAFSFVAPTNNTGHQVTYKEYFGPLAEGVVWMNDPGLYWLVRVNP